MATGPVSLIGAFTGQLVLLFVYHSLTGKEADPPPVPSAPAPAVLECPAAPAANSAWGLSAAAGLGLLAGLGLATLLFLTAGGLIHLGAAWLVGAGTEALRSRFASSSVVDRDVKLYDESPPEQPIAIGDGSGGSSVGSETW